MLSQLLSASRRNYPLLIIWIGLNALDSIATYLVLESGGVEVNPVASLAMHHLELVPALIFKVLLAIPTAMVILRWKPALLIALNIFMICVVTLTGTSVIL